MCDYGKRDSGQADIPGLLQLALVLRCSKTKTNQYNCSDSRRQEDCPLEMAKDGPSKALLVYVLEYPRIQDSAAMKSLLQG